MKLFATDYDETFFMNDRITDSDKLAVAEWRRQGNLFCVCTARCFNSVIEEYRLWKFECDYFICDNGASVYTPEGKAIYEDVMDVSETCGIISRMLEAGAPRLAIANGIQEYTVCPDGNYQKRQTVITGEEVAVRVDRPVAVHGVMATAEDSRDFCYSVNSVSGSRIYAVNDGCNLLIMNRGSDKASGIHRLIDSVGIMKAEVYVIGDGEPDVAMIKEYGGYTVPDGCVEAKKNAKKMYKNIGELLRELSGKEEI